MNPSTPPRLQPRSSDEIVADIARRLGVPLDGTDPLGEGLLRVFGRYVEIVSDRLNRAPEKHHLAFLQLLGSRPMPPTAARVPLTFVPVRQLAQREAAAFAPDREPIHAVVPIRTRVAASAAGPDGEAIVFETDRALELTSLVVRRVVARDAADDRVADHAGLAAGLPSSVRPFIDGMRPARHACYLARPAALAGALSSVSIHFEIGRQGPPPDRAVEWRVGAGGADPSTATRVSPQTDTTAGLAKSGIVTFSGLPVWAAGTVAGIEGLWLRCSLVADARQAAATRSPARPLTNLRIAMSGSFALERQPPQAASFNAQILDLSTGFFPLGPAPRYGDVFCLRSPLFACVGARVVVRLELAGQPFPPAAADGPPVVVWETPIDGHWVALACEDTTRGLGQSGAVAFTVPAGAAMFAVNQVAGGWIRARYLGGLSMGTAPVDPLVLDARAPSSAPSVRGAMFVPAVERVSIDAAKTFAPVPLTFMVTDDDFETAIVRLPAPVPIDPLAPPKFERSGLYLGLEGAPASIDGRSVSFHAVVGDGSVPVLSDDDVRRMPQTTQAELLDGDRWIPLAVVDESRGFTRSGAVSLRFERHARFAGEAPMQARLYWIRLTQGFAPTAKDRPIERILLNTVMATNVATVQNELLGSSDQRANSTFRCARVPVVGDVELDVGEVTQIASSTARNRIAPGARAGAGDGVPPDVAPTWVRWMQVADLSTSGRDDRHFTLDSASGRVAFGDGLHGRIPPAGANNIRMHRYRTGGGASGNVAAGAVSELRTTVPYVTSVTNPVAAIGGSDAGTAEHAAALGSAWLRHRDRAVAREDFEDLAVSVSGIARARCLPLRSLSLDPLGERVYPGWVSVVVVPWSDDDAPRPTTNQLQVVHDVLEARKQPGVRLSVGGPEYVGIDVVAELVCADGEDAEAVVEDCRARIRQFLHPLTGGNAKRGWSFAEHPTPMMLHLVLQHVEGVEQVRQLTMSLREQRPGLLKSDHFLICSGTHRIAWIDRTPAVEVRSP